MLLRRDPWLEALLKLRWYQASELAGFHRDEVELLLALNRQHRLTLAELTEPVERAAAIGTHRRRIKTLNQERNLRYAALKTRHAHERHHLLVIKMTMSQ